MGEPENSFARFMSNLIPLDSEDSMEVNDDSSDDDQSSLLEVLLPPPMEFRDSEVVNSEGPAVNMNANGPNEHRPEVRHMRSNSEHQEAIINLADELWWVKETVEALSYRARDLGAENPTPPVQVDNEMNQGGEVHSELNEEERANQQSLLYASSQVSSGFMSPYYRSPDTSTDEEDKEENEDANLSELSQRTSNRPYGRSGHLSESDEDLAISPEPPRQHCVPLETLDSRNRATKWRRVDDGLYMEIDDDDSVQQEIERGQEEPRAASGASKPLKRKMQPQRVFARGRDCGREAEGAKVGTTRGDAVCDSVSTIVGSAMGAAVSAAIVSAVRNLVISAADHEERPEGLRERLQFFLDKVMALIQAEEGDALNEDTMQAMRSFIVNPPYSGEKDTWIAVAVFLLEQLWEKDVPINFPGPLKPKLELVFTSIRLLMVICKMEKSPETITSEVFIKYSRSKNITHCGMKGGQFGRMTGRYFYQVGEFLGRPRRFKFLEEVLRIKLGARSTLFIKKIQKLIGVRQRK